MLAARTASARPCSTPSARCSSPPTPPLAITGTSTASATARVSARSALARAVDPCSSAGFRLRPAPAFYAPSQPHPIPICLRPPWVNTSHPAPERFASIATTMHCCAHQRPKRRRRAPILNRCGVDGDLVGSALSKRRTSSTLRTPPPTVRMNTCAATFSTMGRIRSRSSSSR